jgi:hypothetical protein
MIDTSGLDRLVDGELADKERRELLTRLDAEPDGWRRCALAFLEAQTWQSSLRTVIDERGDAIATASPATSRERSSHRSGAVIALAASVAVAFFLGFAGGDRWRLAYDDSEVIAAADQNNVDADGRRIIPNVATAEDGNTQNNTPAVERVTTQTVGWNGPRVRVGFLTVENDADGTLSHMPVKVVEGPGVDESWLEQVPPAISARYVELMRQRGYEVEQQREIVPFDVADGQRVMLPVDRVKIIPVSDLAY